MARDNTNGAQVAAWLTEWVKGIDFTKPGGEGRSLGMDVVHAVAGGIRRRALDHTDADGNPWAPNSDRPAGGGYASFKERVYGRVDEPGFRTGQTWSLANLIGRTTIAPDEVVMRGGLDAPPSSSDAPGGHVGDGDREATGRQKLEWAHEDAPGRPARPGYALADEDVDAVMALCEDFTAGYIEDTNRGH